MTNYIFYGLVTSAATFGYTLVLYFLGFETEKIEQGMAFAWLGLVIMLVGMILSMREARKEKLEDNKPMTYGGAFGAGMLTILFMGIGAAVFTYVYGAYINPDKIDYLIEMQQEQLIEQGHPDEVLNRAESMMRNMAKPPVQALMGFFNTVILGLVFSLILAIFMRGKPKEQEVVEVEAMAE